MNKDKAKFVPEVKSVLKSRIIEVPKSIYKASGITILGTRIKSLIFSTDVAIIKNTIGKIFVIIREEGK